MLTPEKVRKIRQVISEPGYYKRRYRLLMFLATQVALLNTLNEFQDMEFPDSRQLIRRATWYKTKITNNMKQVNPMCHIDHTTHEAGLYLNKVHRLSLFTKIKEWDLRLVAPKDKNFLSASTVHTITHIMVDKLRDLLGSQFIGFYPNASKTGFYFISTSNLSKERLGDAIIEVIEHSVPLLNRNEIPGLDPVCCGNENLHNLKDTNTALFNYAQTLRRALHY